MVGIQEKCEEHCKDFESGTDIQTTTHRNLVRTCRLSPTVSIVCLKKTTTTTFSTRFKQDPVSHNTQNVCDMVQKYLAYEPGKSQLTWETATNGYQCQDDTDAKVI